MTLTLATISGRPELPAACDHVAIVGLGPSLDQYIDTAKRWGGRLSDQVWAINALGTVIDCDLIWHMDDVRVQEIRSEAKPESNIANMLKWLKKHPGPIMTSQEVDGYPGLVAFPLEAVLRELGNVYFNSTVAYAMAYAIYMDVKTVSLWGCDYTYPDAHKAEKGRACLEYWVGRAHAVGIKVVVPETTSLLDMCDGGGSGVLYGYDAVDVERADDGEIRFMPKDLPTAEQIETAYDHGRHPNVHVDRAQASTGEIAEPMEQTA